MLHQHHCIAKGEIVLLKVLILNKEKLSNEIYIASTCDVENEVQYSYLWSH